MNFHKFTIFIKYIFSFSLNVYIERASIFTSPPATLTEYDYMAKLWPELFELMFGSDANFIK